MKKKEKLSDEFLVSAKNIGMDFRLVERKYDTLKEHFVALFKFRKNKKKKFTALKDINFEIKKGESLGVIGHNGAGKSTLLKIVAGIYEPTSGSIQTNGKVMLLNLGAGFDMEADAEENIYLNGAILGFTRKQIKEKFDDIIEFSELREFVKVPLKNYSSGMVSRLAFAIAINIRPDLLLVDEVLSVGDANFQKKCGEKIDELKKSGTSFMIVSHGLHLIKQHCQKTLWIENSEIKAYGDTDMVCKMYIDYCNELAKNQQNKGI